MARCMSECWRRETCGVSAGNLEWAIGRHHSLILARILRRETYQHYRHQLLLHIITNRNCQLPRRQQIQCIPFMTIADNLRDIKYSPQSNKSKLDSKDSITKTTRTQRTSTVCKYKEERLKMYQNKKKDSSLKESS